MHWSQVPTRSSRFRVSQMRVLTLRGWELCQIMANTLGICWVVEVELLDEGVDNRDLERSLRVLITLLSRVPKEGQVPQWGGPLLVQFSWILGEAFDEASLKYPKKGKFGEHREVFDHFEGGSMLFLEKDFDQVVAFR